MIAMNGTATKEQPLMASPSFLESAALPGLWERVSFSLSHKALSLLLWLLGPTGLYHFGRMFGTVEWLINHKRRRRFARALSGVLGHTPTASLRRRATRDFFMRSRGDKIFYLIFDRFSPDRAAELLSIRGQDLLDESVARGHGVYLAMSHHGAHHVLSMLLAVRGYRTACVRDRREGAIRRYVQDRFDRRYPEFCKMRVLFADSYPREIFRCFEEGYVLGSAMDVSRRRDPTQRGEMVEIFGEQRVFLTGPLRIAMRCRAPVLQAFIIPERNFRYRLEIVDVLVDVEKVEDEREAISRAMVTYAANVETHVRRFPSLISRV